jgi:hypothetical protein
VSGMESESQSLSGDRHDEGVRREQISAGVVRRPESDISLIDLDLPISSNHALNGMDTQIQDHGIGSIVFDLPSSLTPPDDCIPLIDLTSQRDLPVASGQAEISEFSVWSDTPITASNTSPSHVTIVPKQLRCRTLRQP